MTPQQSARLSDPIARACVAVYADLAARIPALVVAHYLADEAGKEAALDASSSGDFAMSLIVAALAWYVTTGSDPVAHLASATESPHYQRGGWRAALVDAACALRARIMAETSADAREQSEPALFAHSPDLEGWDERAPGLSTLASEPVESAQEVTS